MAQEADVYGRGWAFPPDFSVNGVKMVEGGENVRQSMRVLFQTQPGERIMRPDYGCDLQSSMFRNISEDLLADLQMRVTESVLRHEPRAALKSVNVSQAKQSPNTLEVGVEYRLVGSEQIDQLSGLLNIVEGHVGAF